MNLARTIIWFSVLLSPIQVAAQGETPRSTSLNAAQLFEIADQARARGDYANAEVAYKALTQDPDLELRTEARFRLAKMYADHLNRKREAAVLLRRILDDKPDVTPVRIELARVLAEIGEYEAARRELRAAQAAGLPPDVEQRVRFFANALSETKRLGGSIDVAFAPSTNVNRATSADTLETVIGNFELQEDAQAKSGIGLSAKGQAYARMHLGTKTDLLARANASVIVYRDSRFHDYTLSLQVGPQWSTSRDRLSFAAVTGWRWYGQRPYSVSYGWAANWEHPLSTRSQVRVDAGAFVEDNRQNDLQDGHRYTLAIAVDRAFNNRTGGGLQVFGMRESALDPGYSTLSGGLSGYLYRQIARTTAVLNMSFRHLQGDARLSLYPRRRADNYLSAGASGTFRSLAVGTFAPVISVNYERNWSTLDVYNFDRFGAEFGIAAAF